MSITVKEIFVGRNKLARFDKDSEIIFIFSAGHLGSTSDLILTGEDYLIPTYIIKKSEIEKWYNEHEKVNPNKNYEVIIVIREDGSLGASLYITPEMITFTKISKDDQEHRYDCKKAPTKIYRIMKHERDIYGISCSNMHKILNGPKGSINKFYKKRKDGIEEIISLGKFDTEYGISSYFTNVKQALNYQKELINKVIQFHQDAIFNINLDLTKENPDIYTSEY